LVDVGRRDADIALRIVRPETGDLVLRTLGKVRWTLAAAPVLAEVLGTVRRLGDVPWVTFGDRYAHIPAARWVRDHAGVDPVVRSDSLRLQIAIVASGLGAALLPAPSVAYYGLTPVELAPTVRRGAPLPTPDDLHLLTHRALRGVPRVRAVWDFLLDRAASICQ
jgi:DNA-binding transcriptional LysR family regulator